MKKEQSCGLCYRCEKRAYYLEKGNAPRCECGNPETSVYSCYCYQPVQPIILQRNKHDKRQRFMGWMISAREHRVRIPKLQPKAQKYKDGIMVYWIPKVKEKKEKKKR